MARTNQTIKLYRGNALTVANGSVVKTPDVGLYYGEIAINANGVDPTIYIGKVTNATIDDTDPTALLTDLAEFKSKAWLDANIIGGTPKSAFNTITKISTYLSYLFGDAGDGTGASVDTDAIINTWGEVKSFLAGITSDTAYDFVTLFNTRASANLTYTSGVAGSFIANLYDGTSIKAVAKSGYSQLQVNLTAALGAGSWDSGVTTWTAGTLGTRTQGSSDVAIAASEVESFYNEFHQMFTLVDGKIRANLDFYGVGNVSGYGIGSGSGDSGAIATVYGTSGLNDTLSTYSDTDLTNTFNAYTINYINSRVKALEAGSFNNFTFTKNTTGFSISGGTTAKTLTINNNISLSGTDGASLSIGAGGTLGTAAFTSASAYAPYNATISGVALGSNLNALTIGTGLSGTSYNGSSAVTIALATAYGDTTNPYASKTANYFLAAPNGSAGAPTFRAIVAADIPTLNQNTTGSAATLTTARTFAIAGSTGLTASAVSFNGSANISLTLAGTLAVANGGTGATTLAAGYALIGNGTSAVATRAITDNTTATAVTASTNLITANTLYYHKGNTNITTVGTITTGTWNGTVINPTYGGTGVNNGSKTITLGGNMSTGGAVSFTGGFALALAVTAATSLTLPTSGTLLSTDSVIDCGTF